MSTIVDRFVEYNGRTYRLLWSGQTKYGRRAHLAFTDGSKDFWVDAAKCKDVEAKVAQKRLSRGFGPVVSCWECGCEYSGHMCPVCGEDAF